MPVQIEGTTLWYLIIGALLVAMALIGTLVKRLPISAALLYTLVGVALGPAGVSLIRLDAFDQSRVLELLAEVAVIVSLFSAGLKLRAPLSDRRWGLPLRLAVLAMVPTVALIAAVGVFLLDLPLGAAVLLGAMLAPTDPVLASDVQVSDPGDRDIVRFGLTGEAGLNDGIAFPFVLLGLGLLGLHELGTLGTRWLAVDVVWAVAAGLASGWLLGSAVGHLVLYLRREHKEALGLDEFLALGLIALSYGAALLIGAYGFLAVFAAGLAVRRLEHEASGERAPALTGSMSSPTSPGGLASDPDKAPAYMASAVLGFNEQLERIAEVGIVLIIGSLLAPSTGLADAALLALLLFFVIRPLSVLVSLAGNRTGNLHRGMIGWFGIRGVGSFYYLMYATQQGLPPELAHRLQALVLPVVAASIVVHGISATPLMAFYRGRQSLLQRRRAASRR
jgi:NhaP-type Na+/H+ or K+/H+ antiporter